MKPTTIAPITCPRCGSKELAFITEYHKALILRLLRTVSIIAFAITFILDNSYIAALLFNGTNIPTITIFSIPLYIISILFATASIALHIAIIVCESKTHTQAICRDCGKIWLLN